jgi:hypothetical protein
VRAGLLGAGIPLPAVRKAARHVRAHFANLIRPGRKVVPFFKRTVMRAFARLQVAREHVLFL